MRHAIRVHPNTYLDSVKLLAGSHAIVETPGVDWGAAVTGTPANVELLLDEGFNADDLDDAGANDLVIAVRGNEVDLAIANAETALFAVTSVTSAAGTPSGPTLRSVEETRSLPDVPNLAVISVGGEYAALEAHKALTASMDVLLFSDNVSVEDEIGLKERAAATGRFVMGPGAGTAVIDGIGLGFANAVRRGPIGVVAAAGTGAQEVMSLIDRVGLGVTHVIGVGGRDLSDEVGGVMAAQAIRGLEADPDTEVILLVSKPPSTRVSRQLLNRPQVKPLIAALVGLRDPIDVPAHVTVTSSLEEGVMATANVLGADTTAIDDDLSDRTSLAVERVHPSRTAICGLFSGGTLCFEAMTLMAEQGLSIYSNTPLRPEWDLEAQRIGEPPGEPGAGGGARVARPQGKSGQNLFARRDKGYPYVRDLLSATPDGHICLDLGEEEYTRGRPHPMIDPAARLELIARAGANPHTAVVLLDVVLGYGSHKDPAGELAPACAEVMAIADGPQVVTYVLGTESDPQDLRGQRSKLEDVGCIVTSTNARAALAAAAIATRTPAINP